MAGSTGAIRAGRAFVELYADDSKLVRGLQGASTKLKAWGSAVSGMGKQLMAGGAAITGAILHAAYSAAQSGAALWDMSKRTGMAVESLSLLGYAAQQSGTDLAGVETAVRRMQKTIAGAEDEMEGTSAKGLTDLGLSAKALMGLAPEEQFARIAAQLTAIKSPTEKAAAAMKIFGRSGTSIIPMAEDFARLAEEARAFGLVKTSQSAKEAKETMHAMTLLGMMVKSTWSAVGSAIFPLIREYNERVATVLLDVRNWLRENKALIGTIFKIAVSITAAGAAIVMLGSVLTGLSTILGAVRVAAILAMTPIGAMIAVVAGGILILRHFTKDVAELHSEMQNLRAAGDDLRASDQQQFARLQQLSDKQELSNAEMSEAAKIMGELEGRYGPLNGRLDDLTHTLTLGATAMEDFAAAMRKVAGAQIDAEISELTRNLRELIDESQSGAMFIDTMFTGYGKFEANAKRQREIVKQIGELQTRGWRLGHGETAAALPETAGGAAGAGLEIPSEEAAKINADLQKKLTDLQIAGIKDEETRAQLAIDERWGREVAAAIKAGADLETLQKAWDQERLNSATEFANRRADAEKQAKERSAKESQSLDREVARAKIEATLTGRAKEEALLTQEWKERREDAIDAGMGTGRIDELWDLKKAALDKQDFGGAVKSGFSVGTFGKFALGGLGMGGGPAERTAKATEKTVEHLEFIRRRFTFTGPETSAKFAS